MFKATADLSHYVTRTGSHSTKEHRTGRIDAIPNWALEPEEYYNSTREKWQSLSDQLRNCEDELCKINERLKETLAFKEFQFFQERKAAERARYNALKESVGEYRLMAREAAKHSLASVFLELAKLRLDPKTVVELLDDTRDILGRPLEPIAAGGAELSAEQKHAQRLRERRQRVRKHYKTGNYRNVVQGDFQEEGGGLE